MKMISIQETESHAKQTMSETDPEIGDKKDKSTESSKECLDVTANLRIGSLLHTWTEVSRINYFSSEPLDIITSGQSIRRRSIGLPGTRYSIHNFVPSALHNKSKEDIFAEQFPVNVTTLMNENQLWGCFYIFPELYADVYSPVVSILNIEDVPELVGGILTRDMIAACLTYLHRTPISGEFVYIKLDLSSKNLIDINVLQHYKYLVYLDLSSNLISELKVLSFLPHLQFLSVAFNRLNTVLEYETPQWFLTEVHYKFNSVKKIGDLSLFWSITILDLSHNNIKGISGLENLRYLRRLDLSFNHIQRLENLNNLRLLWLDLSYNNISSFEFSSQKGLHTLLHLEYLNLNENNLTSFKIFSGCTRLRELHARNNGLSMLLELAVYMRQLRRLIVIDLRGNPICSSPGYKDVVINTFPILLNLDAEELDPIDQRNYKMDMTPNIYSFAIRRLLRLLYIEQLSRARVSPYTSPADTTEVPLVVLVGHEAVGKGSLARRLASECQSHVELALQHTTASHHFSGHYREVSRSKFDDMLLAGELLTYTEMAGESYGLSREEAVTKDGQVRLTTMDLIGALMLKFRGRRPYLILTTYMDKKILARKQQERKNALNKATSHRMSLLKNPFERSTLQVLLSERIIITGILNEILLTLPEEKEQSEFVMDSECSLMDTEAVKDGRKVNLLTLLASTTSLKEAYKRVYETDIESVPSLCSLYSYKESQQGTNEYSSYATNGQNSYHHERNQGKRPHDGKQLRGKPETRPNLTRPKSVDFSRYTSLACKGLSTQAPCSSKSSKSVTFTPPENETQEQADVEQITGMLIEPLQRSDKDDNTKLYKSISMRTPWQRTRQSVVGFRQSTDDLDLWLAFLTETGMMEASTILQTTDSAGPGPARLDTKVDETEAFFTELGFYQQEPSYETAASTIRHDYESIHRRHPGLFWDVVAMDKPNEAFQKVKRIIRDIVNSQANLKPMFDIDFTNMSEDYPMVQTKLANIRDQIAPHRLFY